VFERINSVGKKSANPPCISKGLGEQCNSSCKKVAKTSGLSQGLWCCINVELRRFRAPLLHSKIDYETTQKAKAHFANSELKRAPRDLSIPWRLSLCPCFLLFAVCCLLFAVCCLTALSLFRFTGKDLRVHALGISQHYEAHVVHIPLRDALHLGWCDRIQACQQIK